MCDLTFVIHKLTAIYIYSWINEFEEKGGKESKLAVGTEK